MLVANAEANRKRKLDIATDFTTRGAGTDFFAAMATSSEYYQKKWPKGNEYDIVCYANGEGADRAWIWLVTLKIEVFFSSGHATSAPIGQAFCVNDKESYLKPQPAEGDPDNNGGEANGIEFWYLKEKAGEWKDLSNTELAFFNACSTGTQNNTIAPSAAWQCHAQSAVGFYGSNLHGSMWDAFLDAFWHKWGVGWSIEKSLAYAEWHCNENFPTDDPKWGRCGTQNARLFKPPNITINPDPNDWDFE